MHHRTSTVYDGRHIWRWAAMFALLLALLGVVVTPAKAEAVIGSPIPTGNGPSGLAINPQTNRVYVTNKNDNTVTVIDATTNARIDTDPTIPGLQDIPVGNFPLGIAVNPQTNRIYVANYFSASVAVIDGATNARIDTDPTTDGIQDIPVGNQPQGIAVNPQTNRIYVANTSDNTVAVIDGATNARIDTDPTTDGVQDIPVGSQPRGVAVNPQTNRIYVTIAGGCCGDNPASVAVIDGATNARIDTDPTTDGVQDILVSGNTPIGIAVNPQTNRVYTANKYSNTVTVIDTTTNTVIATIPAGSNPRAVTVNAQTNRIYVANGQDEGGANTVQVIDGATNAVVSMLTVGSGAAGIAFNPLTNRGYVANQGDNTVSVFGPAPTAVNGDNATATYGDPSVTLTATVTTAQPGGVNEGTVTFTVRRADSSVLGTATSGTVTNGAASATFALPSGTGGGTYSITAQYNAISPTFEGSVDATPATLTVNRAAQTITFDQPENRNPNDAPFTVNPTTSSGLPLTIDAAGPCLIDGTTVTLTGQSGTCALTARQAGDANYLPATTTRTFQVGAGSAIIASASGNGTVSPAGTTVYGNGTVATYTATPAAGQVFVGWTLDGQYVGYANPLTITVTASHSLVATFAARPTFSDIGGLNAQDQQAITFLAALGIVNPNGVNGSGQFQPGGEVKRAEMAAFVARVFDWQQEFHANNFPDKCDAQGQNCVDDELWNNVAALKDYGIVGGYSDDATCAAAGTTTPCYLPRDTVKRIQVVSIVARAFILTPDLRPTGFWDRLAADGAQYTNVPNSGTQRSDLTTYRANVGTVPGQASDANFGDPNGNGTRLYTVQVLYAAFNAQFGVDRVP